MLERYFVKPSTVDRIRASWLASEIERYVEWMDSQGYAIRNVYRRVPMLCRFAEFTKQHGSTDLRSAASQIEEFASHWRAAHEAGYRTKEARRKIAEEARNPVRQMLQLALEGRVTADRKRKSFPFEAEAPGFLRYLQEERGLRPATIDHYIHRLHGFGDYLKRLSITSLAELSPALVSRLCFPTTTDLWVVLRFPELTGFILFRIDETNLGGITIQVITTRHEKCLRL